MAARTALPLTKLTANAGIDEPAGTAVDPTNGMVITMTSTAIPADSGTDRLLLQIKNTHAATHVVTIKAGANPPAFRKDLGDVTVTAPNAANSIFGPFETARIMQADGTINIDLAAGITGTIVAYLLPRTT